MRIDSFKAFVPGFIRRPLGKLRAVGRRLRVWQRVRAQIVGATASDKQVLARALWRAPLTVWQNLDDWQFPMVQSDCTVTSRGVGLFKVRAGTDDLFHVLPGQEPAVEQAIRQALRPGDTFVDAGSNIGFYTIMAAGIVGKTGAVIACEMMPETAKILRDHLTLNDVTNVAVFEGALSDTSGDTVYASHPSGKCGQASIARSNHGSQIAVQTRTLQAVLTTTKRVHVLKMDLEGAELQALRGLGDSLNKVDLLVFENHTAPDVVKWLQARGFTIKRLDHTNALARREKG